jgi:hypothetical protein
MRSAALWRVALVQVETSSGNERQRRFGFLGWLWRISVGLLILVVGLAGAGLSFQAVATWNDQQEFPAPGELVDIGGYELHINCIGEGSPSTATGVLRSASAAGGRQR